MGIETTQLSLRKTGTKAHWANGEPVPTYPQNYMERGTKYRFDSKECVSAGVGDESTMSNHEIVSMVRMNYYDMHSRPLAELITQAGGRTVRNNPICSAYLSSVIKGMGLRPKRAKRTRAELRGEAIPAPVTQVQEVQETEEEPKPVLRKAKPVAPPRNFAGEIIGILQAEIPAAIKRRVTEDIMADWYHHE